MEKIYIVSIHCLALPMISSGKNRGFPRGCDGIPVGILSILGKTVGLSRGNHGVRGRDYGGERYI